MAQRRGKPRRVKVEPLEFPEPRPKKTPAKEPKRKRELQPA